MKFVFFLIIEIFLFSTIIFSQENCVGENVIKGKSCIGDEITDQEKELYDLINQYRKENNLIEIRISENICIVANRHALDLKLNLKTLTHSWSDCVFDQNDSKTNGCIHNAPKKFIPDFSGFGFENVYYTTGKDVIPANALEAWKKSPLHNSIILNLNPFQKFRWIEGCVAIEGKYASLWFISNNNSSNTSSPVIKGLGVNYETAVKGLTSILTINNVSTTIDSKKWVGTNVGKSAILELFGNDQDIAEGKVSLKIKLEKDNSLSVLNQHILKTFLSNLAPNWNERNKWLTDSLINLKNNSNIQQKINVQNITAELNVTPDKYISLTIKPFIKPVPVEVK